MKKLCSVGGRCDCGFQCSRSFCQRKRYSATAAVVASGFQPPFSSAHNAVPAVSAWPPGGAARESAGRLAEAIKKVLQEVVGRGERNRFRVYDREGQRCRTRGCRGVIKRITQANRSTFYCPVCQK